MSVEQWKPLQFSVRTALFALLACGGLMFLNFRAFGLPTLLLDLIALNLVLLASMKIQSQFTSPSATLGLWLLTAMVVMTTVILMLFTIATLLWLAGLIKVY